MVDLNTSSLRLLCVIGAVGGRYYLWTTGCGCHTYRSRLAYHRHLSARQFISWPPRHFRLPRDARRLACPASTCCRGQRLPEQPTASFPSHRQHGRRVDSTTTLRSDACVGVGRQSTTAGGLGTAGQLRRRWRSSHLPHIIASCGLPHFWFIYGQAYHPARGRTLRSS